MKPTREDFSRASSHPSGHGFTAAQVRILGGDPKTPWIHKFIGKEMPDALWDAFVHAGDAKRAENQKKAKAVGFLRPVTPVTEATINLYTDGSCNPNPGAGGWAVIIPQKDGSEPIKLAGMFMKTTNNRMELMAIYHALRWLNRNQVAGAVVHSDSRYAIDCITKWAPSWKKKGWTKAGGEIKNLDLIKEMHDLYSGLKVTLEWVRGHNGHEWNELADQTAEAARIVGLKGGAAAYGLSLKGV
jgi:ribonuclease HI